MFVKNFIPILFCLICSISLAAPIGSEFTYQGELNQSGQAANGVFDLQFRAYDVDSGGLEVSAPIVIEDINVLDGLFSVTLDFGDSAFMGDRVFLELAVREGASTGGFQQLLPRQEITSAPYALHAQFVGLDSVGSLEVQDGSLQSADLADNSVTASKVAALSIVNGKIAANAVGSSEITDDSITTADLAPDAVTASELASDSVNSASVIDDSLTAADLAADSVGESEISQNAVGSDELTDGSVQSVDLAMDSVTSAQLADETITSSDIMDGSVAASDIDASQVQLRVSGSCPTGQSIRVIDANGDVTCEVDSTGNLNAVWQTSGNAGTNPTMDFIGTTDNQAFEIRVNNTRTLRMEAELATGGPNILAGSAQNSIASGEVGSVIAGGGHPSLLMCGTGGNQPCLNQITESFATIGGGRGNRVTAIDSVISGGVDNSAEGTNSVVSGGQRNHALGPFSAVLGGNTNTAMGTNSVVSAGNGNNANGDRSVVAGGSANDSIGANSTIGGGSLNTVDADLSVIAGGRNNTVNGEESTISGGVDNTVFGSSSVISGGEDNTASQSFSTISGGIRNVASARSSVVSGGEQNTASGQESVIAGGAGNDATRLRSVVSGGLFNVSSGQHATIPGGRDNVAGGEGSWSGGYSAIVRDNTASGDSNGDEGTFAWDGDSDINNTLTSSGPNQFLIRSPGGAWFGTGNGVISPNLQNAAILIESTNGKSPLMARSGGATVMTLQNNGGLTIGSGSSAPANGLNVDGDTLLEGGVEVEGNADLLSDLSVVGRADVDGRLIVNNSARIGTLFPAPTDGLSVGGEANFYGQIGIGTDNPSAHVQIDAPDTSVPLRVRLGGNTKLIVNSNGSVSVGTLTAGSTNGLRVGGNANIDGAISKGGGSFKIDHPLDPENQFLYHSFVESPDMMNVYNGNVMLDSSGEAWVELPDYFVALNREFRYQLTAVGQPGPSLFIAEKIAANQFRISGGAPGMEVSWQVTGVRQDPWAEQNRIPVEVEKTDDEKGRYLHAEAWGIEDRHKSMNHEQENDS